MGIGVAVTETALAWRKWKQEHDVHSARVMCCDTSVKLFACLDEMERTLQAAGALPASAVLVPEPEQVRR